MRRFAFVSIFSLMLLPIVACTEREPEEITQPGEVPGETMPEQPREEPMEGRPGEVGEDETGLGERDMERPGAIEEEEQMRPGQEEPMQPMQPGQEESQSQY